MTTRRFLPIALIAAFATLAPLHAQDARKPFRYAEAKHGPAELKYHGKIPVATVSGTPKEMGEQLAALEGPVVADVQKLIERYVRYRGWHDVYPMILKAGSLLEWNFPPTHRTEFSTAMKAAKLDRDLLILINTAFDVVPAFACSTIVAEPSRSATGSLIFGRNLDLPRFAYLHELTMVTVYHGKGKRPFASVGFPGLFGVVSGINDAGLTLAVNEIFESKDTKLKFSPFGTPKLMLLRRVLEECTTIDQAEKLIRDSLRTGMMAVAVCDKNECAVLEITPKSVVRRRAANGVATCTNHFLSDELCVGEKCKRLDQLDAKRGTAKFSVNDIGAALHAANFGELTMQTMIFEPASLRLHLAFGQLPTSAMPRETLDLMPLLRGAD
jgi:isopenicillin-N N-acyltransferase-like protein